MLEKANCEFYAPTLATHIFSWFGEVSLAYINSGLVPYNHKLNFFKSNLKDIHNIYTFLIIRIYIFTNTPISEFSQVYKI